MQKFIDEMLEFLKNYDGEIPVGGQLTISTISGSNFSLSLGQGTISIPPSASQLDVIFPSADTGSVQLLSSGSVSYLVWKNQTGWWQYVSGSTAVR